MSRARSRAGRCAGPIADPSAETPSPGMGLGSKVAPGRPARMWEERRDQGIVIAAPLLS